MKTSVTQFCDDAKKGGYGTDPSIYYTLLQPSAWRAVGKTRGWGEENNSHITLDGVSEDLKGWKLYLFFFLDHLADGLTIEEALLALEK